MAFERRRRSVLVDAINKRIVIVVQFFLYLGQRIEYDGAVSICASRATEHLDVKFRKLHAIRRFFWDNDAKIP